MRPLGGVRVIELGSVVLAPYAAQWLGDLGAEVIKVEPPGGDATRRTGPGPEPGLGALFLGVNRNKKSVVLDLKSEEGRAALLTLAATADVFVHNNRPAKMRALGLGPEELRSAYPALIYACLHGYQESGPYGGRPAYDDTIQGMSGFAQLSALRDGEPAYAPTILADKTAALMAAIAICAALYRKRVDGQGCYIEAPMFESMVAFTAVEHFWGHYTVPPVADTGYSRAYGAARRPFRAADGFVCIMPYTDRHWQDFVAEAGPPGLAGDPRLDGIESRTRAAVDLYDQLAAVIATMPVSHWTALCERLDIPYAPVRSLAELDRDDRHLAATGFFTDIASGDARLRFPGFPILFDGIRPGIEPPPRLGEHSDAVLASAGVRDMSAGSDGEP